MVEVSFLRTLSNLQWNGLLFIRHPHLTIPKAILMLNEQLASSEIYTKCGDNFLLGLLVHRLTPLLYMKSKLSPAELFFGRRLASTCLLYITVVQNWLLNGNPQMAHPEPGV